MGKRFAAALWVTTELAIIATEIAEVIGSAIALHLLFKIPLLLGVIITVPDVFLLLALMKFGIRKIEALVFTLIATIFIIFAYEVVFANPDLVQIAHAFIPQRDDPHRACDGRRFRFLHHIGDRGCHRDAAQPLPPLLPSYNRVNTTAVISGR